MEQILRSLAVCVIAAQLMMSTPPRDGNRIWVRQSDFRTPSLAGVTVFTIQTRKWPEAKSRGNRERAFSTISHLTWSIPERLAPQPT